MAKKASKKTASSVSKDVVMEQVDLPAEGALEEVAYNAPPSEEAPHNPIEGVAEEEEDAVAERRSKRPRTASAEKVQRPQRHSTDQKPLCRACHSDAISDSLQLLTCSSCALSVHVSCYSSGAGDPVRHDEATWICDVCNHPAKTIPVEAHSCVYCKQPADDAMRCVDTKRWSLEYREGVQGESTAWGHLDCALWDPFADLLKAAQPEKAAEETGQDASGDVIMEEEPSAKGSTTEQPSKDTRSVSTRLELLVPPCCFCDDDHGVRIPCRQLGCGRFFHVRCAGDESHRGYVEVVHTPYPLKHAYCDRHRQCRHNLIDLATKLTSKTMASLVPRDVAQKIATIAKRIDSYVSVDAVFVDLTKLLGDQCNKGLKTSKSDPPTYSMRQLQALQLVIDHLPQLRNVYEASTLSVSESDIVQDTEIIHALQKAFHPHRFVRKFGGPLSQHQQCDLCHEPFQERQHVFYCTSSEQPHALHWKCTKRKANAKESRQGSSASTKKKLKSVALVQQGHWKDVKLPKSLPNVSDGVACGVCRAPVDARGILAGRKEATRIEFEKPTSDFMFGGCFTNEMDTRSAAAAGLRTSRASTSSTTVVSAASASSVLKVAAKTAVRRSASGSGPVPGNEAEGDAVLVLAPPKMERINVRRTTRWLACLGQVIRLALATKKEAAQKVTDGDVATSDKTGEPSNETSGASVAPATPGHESVVQTGDVTGSVEPSDAEATSIREPEEEITSAADDDGSKDPCEPLLATTNGSGVVEGSDALSRDSHMKDEEPNAEVEPSPVKALVDTVEQPPASSLPPSLLAYLEEAKNVVRPYDAYALHKMETAQSMLETRNGPALSVLNTLIQEYTRFLYIKHTRAVAKATNEKRKRLEQEALEERERERKRIDQEAEMALKKQMLAMRKKQRQ